MTEYSGFARFYDALNNEPESRSRKMLHYIEHYSPDATSVLELGCGTGAVLAGLGSGFALAGVDRSPEMLDVARRRCPTAQLHEADITTFHLPQRFDVILCVFDTLNHVPTFAGWREVFARVRDHLTAGGIFVFDVNTLGRLRRLGAASPWVRDFDGNTLIMDVTFDEDGRSEWDVRVFEHRSHDEFVLCHERIVELGVPLNDLRAALEGDFDLLEESDPDGNPPDDQSARAYFVYRVRR